MPAVEQQLRKFVVDSFMYGKGGKFSDDDSFVELGIIDSTGIMELVAFLEKQYQIVIDDSELVPENLDSIARLSEFLRKKTSATRPARARACAAGA